MLELNKIYCMDCLEGMKELDNDSIDLILTDPPFNVDINYGCSTNDNMKDDLYESWMFDRVNEMCRIIKVGNPVIIFSGDKKIHPILDAVERTKLTFHHFLKWHKPSGQRALSGFVLFYRTELALLLTKGKPEQSILNRKEIYSDTLIHDNTKPNDKDAVNHPCRRPVNLYSHIINGFTKENDIVLDPFMGSGTTAVACKKLGRKYIGFEISQEYVDLGNSRVDEVVSIQRSNVEDNDKLF